MGRLKLTRADITTMDVDAIVNAANERMLGGGGVDGAIHAAAGHALYEACIATPEVRPGVRCPTGEARITDGGRLSARFVIHTVGPVWSGDANHDDQLLASCYRRSFDLAIDHALTTIAFPAISCGVYGYPIDRACAVAVSTLQRCLAAAPSFEAVWLVAFSDHVHEAYSELLRNH